MKIMSKYASFLCLLFLLAIVVLPSCDKFGNSTVDYWKVKVGWKYEWGIKPYGSECNENLGKYLENRFYSMTSEPNEYQLTYLDLAKHFNYLIDIQQSDNFIKNKINDEFGKTIQLATAKNCPECGEPLEVNGDFLECSIGYYCGGWRTIRPWAYGRFSDDVLENMKAHADLYVENICKIIGPMDDLREVVRNSVEVKELQTQNVAGFKRYNVLYDISHKHYAICTITDKGDGASQITFEFDSNDIDKVLNMWEVNDLFNNLAE